MKFKVWNGNKNCFERYGFYISPSGNLMRREWSENLEEAPRWCILCVCSERLDRDDNELWEHDIVELHTGGRGNEYELIRKDYVFMLKGTNYDRTVRLSSVNNGRRKKGRIVRKGSKFKL